MPNLPKEIREELKTIISKTTDEALDLVVNLTGKYIAEKEREKLKKEAESEVGTKIEESMTKAYEIGLKLRQEYQQKKLEIGSFKERFYSITDILFEPFVPDIPEQRKIEVLNQALKEAILQELRQ